VRAGRNPSNDLSKADFDKDDYLKPALEDDALLFSLEDVLEAGTATGGSNDAVDGDVSGSEVEQLRQQLSELEARFGEYRAEVARTLDDRWNDKSTSAGPSSSQTGDAESASDHRRDRDYFSSYSYAGTSAIADKAYVH